ncbi:MAG TPA: lipoyl synthase [Nitrospirota bacterium]
MQSISNDAAANDMNGNGRASTRRLPPWFKIRLSTNERSSDVRRLIREHRLHTVCTSAACPNRTECWNSGTATFMILGNVCTRGCRFCGVPKGTPQGLDMDEPGRVARAIASLNLRYAVVTSVTRDDLVNGGASIFAKTITAIRQISPNCKVEVLIPDFQGSSAALKAVLEASPDVLNHNIETVPTLYSRVRPQADYHRSIELLSRAHAYGAATKSGLMLGLGESIDEVKSAMLDLRGIGCDMLTLGQYLQPGKINLPVMKFYSPAEFKELQQEALSRGFRHVASGPMVRSSYHADSMG